MEAGARRLLGAHVHFCRKRSGSAGTIAFGPVSSLRAHPSDVLEPAPSGRRWRLVALVLILAVGAWLRLYQLDQYPLGVHHDELSNMYDGWSIAETGADRFGSYLPIIERAYGENDYRPAM